MGAGAQLPRFREVFIVQATDGAPRGQGRSPAYERSTAAEYAAARRAELEAALAAAGVPADRVIRVGVPDQEASRALPSLRDALARLIEDLAPEVVITHPYEGGHPDHDAVAFAVHAALGRPGSGSGTGRARPVLLEMTSYHARPGGGGMETGVFLPGTGGREAVARLTEAEKRLKARLIECFASQKETLEAFRIDEERFRLAPDYDFTRPPHGGRLGYEDFAWSIAPGEWRRLAREALG